MSKVWMVVDVSDSLELDGMAVDLTVWIPPPPQKAHRYAKESMC